MRIQIIVPAANTEFNEGIRTEAESVIAPDTELSVINLDTGPQTIESRYEEFWATADLIEKSQAAQDNGFDAIFVACFGEPGVEVIRELVEIPIVGGFEPAVLTATIVSQQFSIITVEKRVVPMFETLARGLGITDNLASILEVGIPVEDLEDKERLKEALIAQSQVAIDRDGAQAIVLGCTGMLDVTQDVQQALVDLEKPAPVINPTTAAVTFLQSLVRNQLSQSRLTYYKVNL